MSQDVQMLDLASNEDAVEIIFNSGRPHKVNKRTGVVTLRRADGLRVNSLLRKDEWEEMDRQINEAMRHELRGVSDLQAAGLTNTVGLGTLVSQWQTGSRMSPATINMTGQSVGERDRLEFDLHGVPVPIVFKEFSIGRRQLEATRRLGNQLDFTHAQEATYSVAETLENMLFNGADLVFNGVTIYGYTNHPGRVADTATNFGGGAWTGTGGTLDNVTDTVAGMINALNLYKYYGPFVLYLSTTQYNAIGNTWFTDGSDTTPLDRILRMPQVQDVRELPEETLPNGNGLLVALRRTVIDWTQAMSIQSMEWMAHDNMSQNFKVMTAATPRLKTQSHGKVGVAHVTGLDGG